jgi:LysR family transcriptional regulator, glycine cleavage system transcriptional activator
MRWQLPPLNALKAFEAAARHRSITKAALELNVTQAAVSKQIRSLERYLHQHVFIRLHREIQLTEVGTRYHSTITQLFSELDKSTRAIISHRDRVRIRFTGYHTFNLRWLIPRLSDFYNRYPHIEIDISAELGVVDFDRNDADCAVRTGQGEWLDCRSQYLAPIFFTPVSKLPGPPGLSLANIEDLSQHTLIVSSTRAEVWRNWLTLVGHPDLEPAHWLSFDHGSFCYQAAIEGVGIAIGESVFVDPDVKANRLWYPFPEVYKDRNAYYFLRPHHNDKPGLKEFEDWMVHRAETDMAASIIRP